MVATRADSNSRHQRASRSRNSQKSIYPMSWLDTTSGTAIRYISVPVAPPQSPVPGAGRDCMSAFLHSAFAIGGVTSRRSTRVGDHTYTQPQPALGKSGYGACCLFKRLAPGGLMHIALTPVAVADAQPGTAYCN